MDSSEQVEQNGLHPPSGPWLGFYTYEYVYRGVPWRDFMELALTFSHGILRGHGLDPVGSFIILGRYDAEGGECHWTKTYPGRHTVFYKGYYEGRGIWGTWEITPGWRGGFRIWPRGLGQGIAAAAEESVPTGLEAELPLRPVEPVRPEREVGPWMVVPRALGQVEADADLRLVEPVPLAYDPALPGAAP